MFSPRVVCSHRSLGWQLPQLQHYCSADAALIVVFGEPDLFLAPSLCAAASRMAAGGERSSASSCCDLPRLASFLSVGAVRMKVLRHRCRPRRPIVLHRQGLPARICASWEAAPSLRHVTRARADGLGFAWCVEGILLGSPCCHQSRQLLHCRVGRVSAIE